MEEINATTSMYHNGAFRRNTTSTISEMPQQCLSRLTRVCVATLAPTRFQETINATNKQALADGYKRHWFMIQMGLRLCCVGFATTSLHAHACLCAPWVSLWHLFLPSLEEDLHLLLLSLEEDLREAV